MDNPILDEMPEAYISRPGHAATTRRKAMSKWAHFLHAFGMHRYTRHYNPPSKRIRGGWVLKPVCRDCDAEVIQCTWLE